MSHDGLVALRAASGLVDLIEPLRKEALLEARRGSHAKRPAIHLLIAAECVFRGRNFVPDCLGYADCLFKLESLEGEFPEHLQVEPRHWIPLLAGGGRVPGSLGRWIREWSKELSWRLISGGASTEESEEVLQCYCTRHSLFERNDFGQSGLVISFCEMIEALQRNDRLATAIEAAILNNQKEFSTADIRRVAKSRAWWANGLSKRNKLWRARMRQAIKSLESAMDKLREGLKPPFSEKAGS